MYTEIPLGSFGEDELLSYEKRAYTKHFFCFEFSKKVTVRNSEIVPVGHSVLDKGTSS